MLTSIVAAVVILGVLIVVHEAGHFVMAKRCGVRVLRFSIGYPPKIWSFRRGETEYALSATPFGGYVRMLGDEIGDEPGANDSEILLAETGFDLIAAARAQGFVPVSSDPAEQLLEVAQRARQAGGGGNPIAVFGRPTTALESGLLAELQRRAPATELSRAQGSSAVLKPAEVEGKGAVAEAIGALIAARPAALAETLKSRAFPTQSVGKRILIVVAGPLANFVFAPIALLIVFMYGVPHLLPVLGEVRSGMPAAAAGLHNGDRIVTIDGQPVKTWDALSEAVRSSGGNPLKIELERGQAGTEHEFIVLKPAREHPGGLEGGSGNWVIGVMPRGDSEIERLGPISAAGRAVVETGSMTAMLVSGIAELARGTTPLREALGGPIMIAQLAGQQAHQGFANVALFTVMLSIELAIINLLPVPMLDGGHLAFFVVEAIRGKPVPMKHREMAQRVGLVMLVALMAFVIFNDISRIVQG
ncbi:MAG: RIP metalloprotease RseP [Candidatus Binatales bacterium]